MQQGNRPDDDPLWYKDGVIYQVHIKAFNDSNNDGIGDINGLTQKLDYIRSLGVTVIWVLPFYPSPLRDDGYDIADYLNINPDYGTLEDFRKLLKEAHKKGLKVITELVLNHTSERHELFQRARKSPPGSPQRDFYVWSDTPEKYKGTRIIFQDFESSNWSWDPVAKAYYWHRFYWHQPDLNFDNPEVHRYFRKVADFWFEMGVDGMRLDAVPYLYEREGTNCENLPETHAYLKKFSAYITDKYKNRMLLAEANQWPEDAVAYFGNGDECHMAFHFPLMPRIYMAVQMENRYPIIEILEQTPAIPENCQWAMFLRNHDELTLEMVTDEERDYMYRFFAKDSKARINLGIRRRLAPLVENNRRKIELLNILLFSFPGTPVIYYGDEIGMGDNYYLGDRNGVRTPMQWSPDRNAGFSDVNPQRLFLPVIIDPEYHYETINVAVQQRNSSSLLWWIRRAISIRNSYKAFGRGSIEFLSPDNPKVLAFYRKYKNEVILTVVNLSRFPQVAELELKEFEGYTPVELFSRNSFPVVSGKYVLTLNAYDFYWFALELKKEAVLQNISTEIPTVEPVEPGKSSSLIPTGIEEILLGYLIKNRLIEVPAKVQRLFIRDEFKLNGDEEKSFTVVGIEYLDRNNEYYLIPLSVVRGDPAREILINQPREIIAAISGDDTGTFIVNGLYDESFRKVLFHQLVRKLIRGDKGRILISTEKRIKNIITGELKSSSVKITDDNSSEITFNDAFMIKFYRRIDEGINPGEEIQKILSSKGSFYNIRPYAGSISYSDDSESYSLGLIKESVQFEQSAWNYFLDCALEYFEQMAPADVQPVRNDYVASLFRDERRPEDSSFINIPPIHIDMIRQVGALVARLHLKISAEEENPAFVPEPFSTLYQRSLFQSMRSSAREVLRRITQNLNSYDAKLRENLQVIWENENKIFDFLKEIINRKLTLTKIRIHGNLHLANILFTGKDFLIINFEGPYTVAPSERRLKRSALRDTASVILSLYFTVFTSLDKFLSGRAQPGYESYAEQWWYCMSSNFLESYFAASEGAAFIPGDKKDLNYLLKLYTLEKLLIELRYYLRYDISTAFIPARALKRISETLG